MRCEGCQGEDVEVHASTVHGDMRLCLRCHLTRRPLFRFEVLLQLDHERPQGAIELATDLRRPVRSVNRALAELSSRGEARTVDAGWLLSVSPAQREDAPAQSAPLTALSV